MCPGSPWQIEQIGEVEANSSIFASEGEDKHDLTNRILDGEIVDSELPTDVIETINAVREIEAAVRMEYGEFISLSEVQVDLSPIGFEQTDNNNRIDRLLIIPRYGCVVIDYKYGVRYVPPAQYNDQLKAYAWGAVEKFGGIWVWGHVIQPNATSGAIVSDARWDREQLVFEIGPDLMAVNSATYQEGAKLVRGRHCDFCQARDINCPLHHGSVSLVPRNVQIESHIANISPVERSDLYENLKALKGWAERSLSIVEALALSGQYAFESHEVGTGNSRRQWKDEAKAVEGLTAIALEKGYSSDDVLQIISPSQAEKLLGKSAAIREALEPLIEALPGAPKLVRRKNNG